MSTTTDLSSPVVVITGGAGGIGLALGEAFGSGGATVHLLDIDGDRAVEEASRLSGLGHRIAGGAVDVADAGSVARAVDDVLARYGAIDVLCNNAGVVDGLKTVDTVDEPTWDRLFAINAKGPFLMTKAVLPGMRERQRGVIINVASVAGIVSGVSGAAYTASKHAVLGLTKDVATTYGREGIRCNAICPGGVDSGMPIGSSDDPEFDERVTRIRATQPRRGLPSEIAGVATFLASDAASFVNGATIVVDGGWTSGLL